MIDRRIRIPKDKSDFIDNLLSSDGGIGPFQYKVDVLAFAAMVGAIRNSSVPFTEATKEPIRQDVFDRQGYDSIMNLLAIYATESPSALSDDHDKIIARAETFEAYANGGLEIMKEKFKGAADYTNEILLMINERKKKDEGTTDIDITELLN